MSNQVNAAVEVRGLGIIDALRAVMQGICTGAIMFNRAMNTADEYVSIAEKHAQKTSKSYALEWDAELAALDAQLKAKALPKAA